MAAPDLDIRESGNSTAGENYSLDCLISETTLSTRNKWFLQDNGQKNRTEVSNSSTRTITNTSTHSLLSFSPLYQSHSGNYTCSVTVDNVGQELLLNFEIIVLGMGCMDRNSSMYIVNIIYVSALFYAVPQISAQITSTPIEVTPIAGQNYTITCVVLGADNLNSTLTYKWTKSNSSQTLCIPTTNNALFNFSPIKISDAGNYSCEVNNSSNYLEESVVVVKSNSKHLQVQSKSQYKLRLSYSVI